MAGHSRFKKIKHKKAAVDQKRSNDYARVSRELTIAAKLGGGDPHTNPRLRMAMLSAKQVNFPKIKIEDAIKKGTNPNEGDILEEVRYEGFGHSGVAIMVEAAVTSKQIQMEKSVIRKMFAKHGGSLGEEGCVAYMFRRLGLITYPGDVRPEDDMFLLAVEHGAEDCQRVDDEYEILCSFENLQSVRDEMEKTLGEPSNAKLIWKPSNTVMLDHIKTKAVLTLLDKLEEIDSVQEVWSNIEIPDDYSDDS